MLIPKKIKHRKQHKGVLKGRASAGTTLSFGSFGLKALENCWLSSRQIEAARRTIVHYFKRGGKVWIRVFPSRPITQKGEQSTMGGGKGSPEYYVAIIKPGAIIFEIDGVTEEIAKEALTLAAHKLPTKTKFVTKYK